MPIVQWLVLAENQRGLPIEEQRRFVIILHVQSGHRKGSCTGGAASLRNLKLAVPSLRGRSGESLLTVDLRAPDKSE